jgi:hypothetical protein
VDLLARPQVVEDGWSRRELSWRPLVATFEAGLAELPEWHRDTAPVPEADAVAWPEGARRRLSS